jgi:phage minor structural protein
MILKIIGNNTVYVYKDIDRTFFRTRSAGGMMYLQFDISVKHELYKYIQEETRLEYDGQRYIVKGINERTKAKICTINAELDLTGLSNKVYQEKTFSTQTFHDLCLDILSGTGWTIVDDDLVAKRTATEATDKTPRKILEQCTNGTSYNTCYMFDSINKVIHVITPYNNTTSCGTYFTDELNLQEVTFKGSSSGLVTRLYPIGKDGLTIASVNNNKTYLDNFEYSTDIIANVWRDERYTNAQELKDDAVVKLQAMACPERSYTCRILDLAKTKPGVYGSHLAFDLYDVVTLIDRNRQSRVDHRIVEIKEYPADHTLDTVTLSSVASRVIGKIDTLESRLTELDAQTLHDRTKVNEIKRDLDSTVLHVSQSWASSVEESWFVQTADGLYLETSKMLGSTRWSTMLQQSSNAIQIAWNNISKYIKFEAGELCIYDSDVESEQKLRSKFNDEGNHFYRDGYYVGKIGTNSAARYILLSSKPDDWETNYSNYYRKIRDRYGSISGSSAPTFIENHYYEKDTTHKGLVFDLDTQGKYMAFAQKSRNGEDTTYTTMLCFSRENSIYNEYGLHLGCDFYCHYNTIHDVYLDGVRTYINGSSVPSHTGEIPIVTDCSLSGDQLSVTKKTLLVSNGIVYGIRS